MMGGMAGTKHAFASAARDIVFASHSPAGNVRLRGMRAAVALADTTNENIQSVTITTPWAADANELKVGLDIKLRGRLKSTLTPAEAQLVWIAGTLQLDREGSAWVNGSPAFTGQLAPGTKIVVGTIGGFIAVQISFRAMSGAAANLSYAREVNCFIGGISYSQGNEAVTDCTVTADIGAPPALTGPTDVFGASGFRALTLSGQTAQGVACQYESNDGRLHITGESTGTFTTGLTLFTLPAPFRPRQKHFRLGHGLASAALTVYNLTFNTSGTVVLSTPATIQSLFLDSLVPANFSSF